MPSRRDSRNPSYGPTRIALLWQHRLQALQTYENGLSRRRLEATPALASPEGTAAPPVGSPKRVRRYLPLALPSALPSPFISPLPSALPVPLPSPLAAALLGALPDALPELFPELFVSALPSPLPSSLPSPLPCALQP